MSDDGEVVREDKVTQAVQFLGDSRVSAAPLEKAIGFLQRKGLTAGEIREALKRATKTVTPEIESLLQNPETSAPSAAAGAASGALQTSGAVVAAPQTGSAQPQVVYYTQPPNQSTLQPRQTWKEAVLWAGALCGIVLAVREVLKKHVVPIYFPEEAEGKRLKDLQSEVRQLGEGMNQLQEALKESQNKDDMGGITETMKLFTSQIKELNVHNASQRRSVELLQRKVDLVQNSLQESKESRVADGAGSSAATVSLKKAPPADPAPHPHPHPESTVEDDFFSMKPSSIDTFTANRTLDGADKHKEIQKAMAEQVKNLSLPSYDNDVAKANGSQASTGESQPAERNNLDEIQPA
ncbi:hypothetical protein NDN08_001623 [Rhodosorus marinus]|uniref:Peroxisomal membrane protein PEX14 n=1 Tax=Rhodosorus marinus TaxID=101924 RepID=A0AAV8UU50_9RHOD|nr:hypothetical protein NDN08_001623 [Rhodosorus marinus]